MQHDTTLDLDAQDYFGLAVARVASTLLTRWPDDRCKIDRAVALVQAGKVRLADYRHARVESDTTEGFWYTVNASCDCQSFVRQGHRCKHRYSAYIYREALNQLRDEAEAKAEAAPPPAWPVVTTTPQPTAVHRYCLAHDRLLVRRYQGTLPVYGHVDRARRFRLCPG